MIIIGGFAATKHIAGGHGHQPNVCSERKFDARILFKTTAPKENQEM